MRILKDFLLALLAGFVIGGIAASVSPHNLARAFWIGAVGTCFALALILWADHKGFQFPFAWRGIRSTPSTGGRHLLAGHIRNQTVRLADLVAPVHKDPAPNTTTLSLPPLVIQGRTLEDCVIYGPAVIYMTGTGEMDSCEFYGGTFWEIPPDGMLPSAVVILRDCRFRRCKFVRVVLTGTAEELLAWAKGFSQPMPYTPNIQINVTGKGGDGGAGLAGGGGGGALGGEGGKGGTYIAPTERDHEGDATS